MDLLDRILELCSKNNIKIAKLEKETGLANGSVKKWKDVYPSADRLQKVANYFNVSVDYLLGRTENPNVNPDEGIPAEAREEFNNFIEYLKVKYKKRDIND